MKLKSKIPFAKNFALLFSSLTTVVLGIFIFSHSLELDFNTNMYILVNIIPAAVIMGFLGYLCGKVFETSKIIQTMVDED